MKILKLFACYQGHFTEQLGRSGNVNVEEEEAEKTRKMIAVLLLSL
jgi:hypothetical protein